MFSIPKIFLLVIFFTISLFGQATLESTFKFEQINGLSIPFQNGIPVPSFEKQNRRVIDLAGEWKKERFVSDDEITLAKRDETGYQNLITESGEKYLPGFDDSSWETKILPSVENELKAVNTTPEYYENGVWYRKKIFVEPDLESSFVKLMFYSVNYIADVWVNGNYLGYHEGGYTPFAFDVSKYLNYGSENTIAVRVDNIPWGPRKDIVPYAACDWFNYTGIIHDVYLEFTDPASIIRANVVPVDLNGNLETNITILNKYNTEKDISVKLTLFEAAITEENIHSEFTGDIVGEKAAYSGIDQNSFLLGAGETYNWKTSLTISNPKLWSMENPDLYVLKAELSMAGIVVDEYCTQLGVRIVRTEGNNFILNDRIRFLPGAARHEDHPSFGRSVPKDIIYSDLLKVKELNVNFLRTGHYPNHLYTYLIADRIGLATLQEIPVYWFHSADAWKIQNEGRKIHLQMFREMVFKDYNRPSLMFWSASNECHEETNRLIFNNMVVDDISANYADGRLITQSSAGDIPGPADLTNAPLDIAGWTLYFGIFHGSSYYGGTVNFLLQAMNNFPDKPIMDTEFGYWAQTENTFQNQVTVFNETFKAFKLFSKLRQDGTLNNNGSLMAATWWCVFDWYSHLHARDIQSMGLIEMDRGFEKPVASVLRNNYLPYFYNEGVLTGVNENNELEPLKNDFNLEQNFPNPFNPTTTIKYEIPGVLTGDNVNDSAVRTGDDPLNSNSNLLDIGQHMSLPQFHVKLAVYDILGREISILVNEIQNPGNYQIEFNAENLPSGTYFYKLKAGEEIKVSKMMLLK